VHEVPEEHDHSADGSGVFVDLRGWFAAPKLVGGIDYFEKFLSPVFSMYAPPVAEVRSGW